MQPGTGDRGRGNSHLVVEEVEGVEVVEVHPKPLQPKLSKFLKA